MTTESTPIHSQSSTSGFGALRTNRAARYVIAEFVLLAVWLVQLVVARAGPDASLGHGWFRRKPCPPARHGRCRTRAGRRRKVHELAGLSILLLAERRTPGLRAAHPW